MSFFPGSRSKETGWVYICSMDLAPGQYKIGKARNVKKRLQQFNNTSPTQLVWAQEREDFHAWEKYLHATFAAYRLPQSEHFMLSDD